MAVEYIKREDALCFEMEIEADPEEIQAITKGMALYGEYIKSIPAADVAERSRGVWLRTEAYPHRVYCSVCFATYLKNEKWIDELLVPMNYCPNCGARM